MEKIMKEQIDEVIEKVTVEAGKISATFSQIICKNMKMAQKKLAIQN